jgi:hypothetical protein
MVESQPMFRRTLRYRVVDASAGRIDEGDVEVGDLRERQPWVGDPIEPRAGVSCRGS